MKMAKEKLKLYNTDEKHLRDLISSAAERQYGKDVEEFGLDLAYHQTRDYLEDANRRKKTLWQEFRNNYLDEEEAEDLLTYGLDLPSVVDYNLDSAVKDGFKLGEGIKKNLEPDRSKNINIKRLSSPNERPNIEELLKNPNVFVGNFYLPMSIVSFTESLYCMKNNHSSFNNGLYFSEKELYKAAQNIFKHLGYMSRESPSSEADWRGIRESFLDRRIRSIVNERVKNDVDYAQHLQEQGEK